MAKYKMAELESKFADIIWEEEPINSGELVKLAEKELQWKKPTTYTVLRKLCQKGIFKNIGAVVTAIVSREEFYAEQGKEIVFEAFSGSLPRFVAAFAGREKLSKKDIEELQTLIDSYREV